MSNTNSLTSGDLNLESVVDLSGNTVTDLNITASGSDGIHVNGGGAKLNSATVAADSTINGVFGSYQHAYSSSWGPMLSGASNTYTVNLNDLKAGTTYTVNILGGRNGGIGLPASMSSTWTLSSGSATLNTGLSQFIHFDGPPPGSSSTIQETGTGPYTISYALAIGDAGMTTWVFDVATDGTDIQLGFVNPINAMKIDTVAVPEPASLALMGIAGLGFVCMARRRK